MVSLTEQYDVPILHLLDIIFIVRALTSGVFRLGRSYSGHDNSLSVLRLNFHEKKCFSSSFLLLCYCLLNHNGVKKILAIAEMRLSVRCLRD